MIRVLHVLHSLNIGGVETCLMNLYRNIDRDKVQFDFLVRIKERGVFEDEIESLGGHVYRVTEKSIHFFKYIKELKKFYKEHPYKITHFHLVCLSNIEMIKMAKKCNNSIVILHSRNNSYDGKLRNILHRINKVLVNKYVDYYFSVSDLAAKWLFSKKIYKENKYQVIDNGTDIDRFLYNEEIRKKLRKELKLDNYKIIGHVGRFAIQKNHTFLIDIFNEVHKIDKKTKLLLIGDGELRSEIEEKIKKLNLEKDVIFLGEKHNVCDYLQAMDVFLFPSLYEGCPRSLVEAQSADLPCVVSKDVIPKKSHVLETYRTVSLKSSPKEWAEVVIEQLKYKDRKNRKKELVKSGNDIKKTAKELQKFYLDNYNKLK